MATPGVPKCHLCRCPALYEDGAIKCSKCKDITCGDCVKQHGSLCQVCHIHLCTKCASSHLVADCVDCQSTLCFNIRKRHDDHFKRKHLFCKGCKSYHCSKLPSTSMKRFLKNQSDYGHYCSQCIWKQIRCYFCKQMCITCPYICHTCNAPVCEDCKSCGHFANDTHMCRGCECREARAEAKYWRENYRKATIAYTLATLSPVIGRYVKLFIH